MKIGSWQFDGRKCNVFANKAGAPGGGSAGLDEHSIDITVSLNGDWVGVVSALHHEVYEVSMVLREVSFYPGFSVRGALKTNICFWMTHERFDEVSATASTFLFKVLHLAPYRLEREWCKHTGTKFPAGGRKTN